jgi:predicted transglutaminase-like cysteine proteinase
MKLLLSSLAICVLASAVGGCASDIPASTAMVDGAPTAPPAGWVSYCVRHSEDSGCRP